ncbi:MAG: hypothetical protein HC896_03945 [Bacteroidales bacterium]|nr:hypothetical protein [Bacteroidales bacterium]
MVASTGSEIVEPNEKPTGPKIRNSNSFQLLAQLQALGLSATYGGIITDNEESLQDFIEANARENDIVFLTGGVSVGEYDLVAAVLPKLGFKVLFQGVAYNLVSLFAWLPEITVRYWPCLATRYLLIYSSSYWANH